MNFPFQKGAEVKNKSIISPPKRDDRHKNTKKHTIIVKVSQLKILYVELNTTN